MKSFARNSYRCLWVKSIISQSTHSKLLSNFIMEYWSQSRLPQNTPSEMLIYNILTVSIQSIDVKRERVATVITCYQIHKMLLWNHRMVYPTLANNVRPSQVFIYLYQALISLWYLPWAPFAHSMMALAWSLCQGSSSCKLDEEHGWYMPADFQLLAVAAGWVGHSPEIAYPWPSTSHHCLATRTQQVRNVCEINSHSLATNQD